mmetsp:Transcript_59896/g.106528  ORF Transcript_59896/g.106528 Transcript_59896/m.106528 type:complete len:943 (-) Transcript_59896:55-2883(-)
MKPQRRVSLGRQSLLGIKRPSSLGQLDLLRVPNSSVEHLLSEDEFRIGGPPRISKGIGKAVQQATEEIIRGSSLASLESLRRGLRRPSSRMSKLAPLTESQESQAAQASQAAPAKTPESAPEPEKLRSQAKMLPPLSASEPDLRISPSSAAAVPTPLRQLSKSTLKAKKATELLEKPPFESLRAPKELLQRSRIETVGFSSSELQRMRQAFNRFKPSDTAEISRGDLPHIMAHLGYLCVYAEAADEVAKQVSNYSTLSFEEFTEFSARCAEREQAGILVAFEACCSTNDRLPKVKESSLTSLLIKLGLFSRKTAISESFRFAGLQKDLSFEQLLTFLAVHRASEGFTKKEIQAARDAFESHSRSIPGRTSPEMDMKCLSSAMVQVFGQHVADRWKALRLQLLGEQGGSSSPLDFWEFLVWARRLRSAELEELRKEFDSVAREGLAAAGDLLPLLPIRSPLLRSHAGELLRDAGIADVQQLTFEDADDFVKHYRQSGGFSKKETAELSEVFKRFDYDASGTIEVLELVDLLSYLGFNSRLEHVHEIIKASDTDEDGAIDWEEFLYIMSLHGQKEMKATQTAFDEAVEAEPERSALELSATALKRLGQLPTLERLEQIIDGVGVTEELDFQSFAAVARVCRGELAEVRRKHAAWPDRHVELLQGLFQVLSLRPGCLDRGGLLRLLDSLGVPAKSPEEREKILEALDPARQSAMDSGASQAEAGAFGSSSATFLTLLHLLRETARGGQRSVVECEMKAISEVGWSTSEVSEFRQVFASVVMPERDAVALDEVASRAFSTRRRKSMPALSPSSSAGNQLFSACDTVVLEELKASLYLNGKGVSVSVKEVLDLFRRMGLKFTAQERAELKDKALALAAIKLEDDDLTARVVDFATFLRLMRWMLESNFGDVNGISAMVVRAQTMMEAMPASPAAWSRLQARCRASVI